ncbi:hypothetical protein [Occallatibacter savannae]|uniref:hypothetical protein n=1 Tax=Occallatibacter savannae TaxID=1002691 RepID=UPI000D688805|nr:hypothetical protein [Occallatibacter savannae]
MKNISDNVAVSQVKASKPPGGSRQTCIHRLLLLVAIVLSAIQMAWAAEWKYVREGYTFRWDLDSDHATLVRTDNKQRVWEGGVLPAFWLRVHDRSYELDAGKVDWSRSQLGPQGGKLTANYRYGRAQIQFRALANGISFDSVHMEWAHPVPEIVDVYFGVSRLTDRQRRTVASLERPFWPNWQAEGYAIPSAKSSPVLSFFRASVFGNTEFPLGTFNTSGQLYAAAFPRPIYAGAMGGDAGWVALGAGDIPDGAMYLQVRAMCGALRYGYREDLWGAGPDRREWQLPLVLQWGKTAWDAYASLFASIGDGLPVSAVHQKAHWNSWGDFQKEDYNVREIADVAKSFDAEELTLDMGWETFESSGIPNHQHIPDFEGAISYIHAKGLDLGFWQSLTWVKDPAAVGLSDADLLCGADGKPRLNNNFHNPFWSDSSYFVLDPSSDRAQQFLRERTRRTLQTTGAKLLKLDFAYALPPPDVAVPRKRAMRGERYAYTLLKIVGDAAREVDPDVTLQYYGISPLLKGVYNLVALDDLADAGNDEPGGHAQWSVWAALAGMRGFALMASSGYDWHSDPEILLDTAVLGAPGTVLHRSLPDGSKVPDYFVTRRRALNRWYRRQVGWQPLWLNSSKGSLEGEPSLKCWGRLEDGGKLTVLTLRGAQSRLDGYSGAERLRWSGRWALISQDSGDIFRTKRLAVIPFDFGSLSFARRIRPSRVLAVHADATMEYANWKWGDGLLTIGTPPAQQDFDALLGFLVED